MLSHGSRREGDGLHPQAMAVAAPDVRFVPPACVCVCSPIPYTLHVCAAAKEQEERQRKRDAITRPPQSSNGQEDRIVLYTQVGIPYVSSCSEGGDR